MLLRVPDDLHSRLARRAHRLGRSVNAVANEILDQTADESVDARTLLRAKANRLGILATAPSSLAPGPVTVELRTKAVASTRGIGRVLDRLLVDGR
ncbi:MAG: FitA-like ribbon-helix-helix domain-containing protein [Mycobacteriales bacterium]